jgi:hypothetical protein
MLTTSDALGVIETKLRMLTDRTEITQLCDRYVRHLDADRLDDFWFASVFTDDVELTFPMGNYSGMKGLAEFHEMARQTSELTHHLSGNYDIDVDGDQGHVRAHLTAVHVPQRSEPSRHFTIGGHYRATVVRTLNGWRISRFVFDLVWNSGDLPGPARPAPENGA